MEVTLLDFTVHNVDVAEGHATQPVGKTAFYLPLDTKRIHREPTVHHAYDTIHGEITVLCNLHFYCLSNR